MKLNARLIRSRHGVYYFRYIIPIHLQTALGRREIKRSLNTKDPNTAYSFAHGISLCLATGINHLANLPILEISKIFSQSDWSKFMHQLHIAKWVVRDKTNQLEYEADPNKPNDAESLKNFLMEMYGQNIALQKNTLTEVIQNQNTEVSAKINDFLEGWQKRIAKNNPKTVAEYISKFNLFLGHIGKDRAIEDIDQKLIFTYVNDLKVGKVTGTPLSENSVNKHIAAINSFLNCAKLQGAFQSDNPLPTYGQKLKPNYIDSTSYAQFTDEDISIIFDAKNILNPELIANGTFKPHMYWLPLLGLYTGARIEELCQLELSDVDLKNDNNHSIWIIDINDNNQKNLKSVSSRRIIPIHPTLIKLGLIEYIKDVKKHFPDEKLLFPYLIPNKYGKLSDGPSKWFGRYLDDLNIKNKGKVFHSFRGTANNKLKQAGISEEARCQLIGHIHKSVNSNNYSQKFDPHWLLENVIAKLVFPTIHLQYQSDNFIASIRKHLAIKQSKQKNLQAKTRN